MKLYGIALMAVLLAGCDDAPALASQECVAAMNDVGAWKVLRFGKSKENPSGLITAEWMEGKDASPGKLVESWWALLPKGDREKSHTPLNGGGKYKIVAYWNSRYRVACNSESIKG